MDVILPEGGADADERRDPRFEGRVDCYLVSRGARWRCWLRDLSLGGAGVEPALPALIDRPVTLTSAVFDFDPPLGGRVINVAHRRTCIAFDLEPATRAALRKFLEENT